jgi:hypothetical protein
LVGKEEGAEASIWPKVAVAEFVGGGQERRETAAAIRVHQSNTGKRGVRVCLTDLDPSRLGSTSLVG